MEFTKLSSKGQVVIPQEIREKMHLKDGTPFMVSSTSESILLTKIETNKVKAWDEATKPFREAAKSLKLTGKDVERMIKESRRLKYDKDRK